MIETSTEYQKAMSENHFFTARVICTLKDGTKLKFDEANLRADGVKISDAVSSTSNFEIGTAITNQLTLSIYNENDAFSDYDFTNAEIKTWIGLKLESDIEWLKKGVFIASDPTTTPDVITIKALDNMSKFDKVYDGKLTFPATLQKIVQYCCLQCGVALADSLFDNYTYEVHTNPLKASENVTYRAIIAYCALLAGCYARCNRDGKLELNWYDRTAFDNIVDGGIFDITDKNNYQSGSELDGGNFTDYSSGDEYDSGNFVDDLPYWHLHRFSSLSVNTDDILITGVRVTAADSEDETGDIKGETYLCGAEGYVIDISGNPFIEAGRAKEIAEYLAVKVVGMKFRAFDANVEGNPAWEAGDAVVLTDRKGNSYYSYLTNVSYNIGNYASISCGAEPAERHSADRYEEINKIVADIKKNAQKELTKYEKFLEQLNSLATNAMGYYETQEKQSDGSTIMYMHDKPDLKDSTVVYKKTIDGFFWSKDGGRTWISGIDKDGNAVLNVIAATGIRGDWIDADSITAKQLSVDYKKSVTKEIEDADRQLKEWSTSYITQTISTAEDKITLKNAKEIAALMHCYTKNGEFSDTLERWQNSNTTVISLVEHKTLGKCVRFSGASTSAYLQQYWSDMQAGTYKLRFKAATDAGYESRARVKCSFNSMQRLTDAGALKADEWTQFEFEFEATATGKKYLYLYDYVSGIPIYLKDVELLGKYEIYNEAQIVLLDNKISLKVTKDEVNSLIEQSAESIRLKASKISWQSTYSSMSESGVLKCTNAELKGTLKAGSDTGYWVQLASTGKLTGGYGNNQYGYIDYSATAKNLNTGAVHKGLQIQGGCLRISTNELATRSSSNVSDTAYIGGTGTISYISKIVDNGNGSITWYTSDLTFENGLMVTDI